MIRYPLSTPSRPATRRLATATLSAALLAAGLAPAAGAAEGAGLKAEALAQIEALLEEKAARGPAERKVSSQLLAEIARRQQKARPSPSAALRTGLEIGGDGRVAVDLDAAVSPGLLRHIEALGGEVVSAFPRFEAVRARLPLAGIEPLASLAEVRFVRPADRMLSQMINTTQGDVAHGADLARATFGVDGTGVKVGVISDSVDALASVQASGDLPPTVTVLPGQDGNPGTSEGTALMEIVHDMAPGAELFFATGAGGQAQLAQNILDLQAAGCRVIVDDVLYFTEPVFQDGIVAQAVDQVFAAGSFYFSAAGNSGNLNDGTSGVWEGDYLPTALPAPLVGAGLSAHDFGGGDDNNEITADPPVLVTLQWADPQDGAANDYDLFLLDPTLSNVLAASTNVQDGTQDPLEAIDSTAADDTGNRLVVVLFGGEGRFLHLNTHRGRLATATEGQIFGHPAARGAMAVAAVDVATAGGGPFTGGAANPVQTFSSDGPRRIFFDPAGAPIASVDGDTRGVASEVRNKPDIAAADGVETATPGFNPFFGTSASAPHSAGIAALLLDLWPTVSGPGIYDLFRSTALDIEDFGFDRDSGAGIIMTLEPMANTIFADGFESGDAAAWTEQAP